MKWSVKFYLTNIRNTNPKLRQIRLVVRGKFGFIEIPTGLYVDSEKWNQAENRVKPKNKIDTDVNFKLAEYKNTAEKILYSNMANAVKTIDPESFKKEFLIASGLQKQNKDDIGYLFDVFINESKVINSWSKSHINHYNTLKNDICSFKNIKIANNINESFLAKFIDYLINKGLHNITINKKYEYLKSFLYWCERKGYYTLSAHKTFKIRLIDSNAESKEIVYLEWEELMRLYNFNFTKPYLARVRDFFCFECFTGLRYSDVAKLKKKDVKEGFINVITKKTSDNLTIPLNRYSQSILDKYADNKSEFAVPSISNQKTNNFLKEAAKMAEINSTQKIVSFSGIEKTEQYYEKWEVLTTHAGRRTFVVNALNLEIPIEVIMEITGHKSLREIRPYKKITDKLKQDAMSKFNSI